MNFDLTDDQVRLREEVLKFAEREINPGASERDSSGRFDRKIWEACGKLALPGLAVPGEFGGAGFDALTTAVVMEALGFGSADNGLTFSLAAHLVAVAVPVAQFGTPQQKAKWFPGLCNGQTIGCHAITESETGSDAFQMKTSALKKGSKFRLNGTKTFATNAAVADVTVVFASTNPEKGALGGSTAFLLDMTRKGISRGKPFEKMGLRSSPTGELFFEDVELDEADVLGRVGGGLAVFVHAMNWERTILFAAHCGAMRRVFERAVTQARTRKQFGQAIGKYQAISHRIADMRVRLEASRLLAYQAAVKLEKARGVSMDACMAKLFISESWVQAGLGSLQIHGGFGYMSESGVEREVRDSLASTLYSGTSEIQRNIIARWLGL